MTRLFLMGATAWALLAGATKATTDMRRTGTRSLDRI